MKYILGIVVILIIGTLFFVLRPEPTYEAGQSTVTEKAIEVEEQVSPEQVEEDLRRQQMEETYAKLEKARRNLERRLSRVKALLWNLKLPAAESAAIQEQMKNGYALLKNKKLLGAFFSYDDLKTELERVEFAYNNIVALDEKIREIKSENKT